jgi:hypothetical protein
LIQPPTVAFVPALVLAFVPAFPAFVLAFVPAVMSVLSEGNLLLPLLFFLSFPLGESAS